MVLNKQSHHASFKQTKRDLKKKRLGHRMMHGKAFWKSGIDEIAKASRDIASRPHKGAYSAPYEIPAARANVLTYVGLWSTAIKLNPSWKMEVSKSAWIKGCKWEVDWHLQIFNFLDFLDVRDFFWSMKCIINMANWLRDECTEVNSHHPCNPQDLTIKLVLLFYRNVSWTSIKGKGQITEEFSASAIQCSQEVQCCSGVFVVNFKHISHLFLVFLLLTLNR